MKLLLTLPVLAGATAVQSAASLQSAPVPTTFVSSLRARAPAAHNATAPTATTSRDMRSQLDSILAAARPFVSVYMANKPLTASSPEEEEQGRLQDQVLADLFPNLSGFLRHTRPSATESPGQVDRDTAEAILALLSKKAWAVGAITNAGADVDAAAPTAAAVTTTSSAPSPSSTLPPSSSTESMDLAEQIQNAQSNIPDPTSVLANTPKGEIFAVLAPIVDRLPEDQQQILKQLVSAAQDGSGPAVTTVDELISSVEQGTLLASLLLKGVNQSELGQKLGGSKGPLGQALDLVQNQVADWGKLVADFVHGLTGH
ncbi:hypothetical protein PWT90_02494 [Aphanocladium album]|nr:hypothetical protein PWT90_02494 [Aphanocladium album]